MKNFLYHRECNNALNRTRGQILLKVCRIIQDNLFFILKLQVDKCFSLCLFKNGGTLIFTTHYPELLDEYDRNDGICIVRNRNGITAENLSYILKRNDIKKSDAYQSGFLEGTTPAYEAYMRLKKSLAASIN